MSFVSKPRQCSDCPHDAHGTACPSCDCSTRSGWTHDLEWQGPDGDLADFVLSCVDLFLPDELNDAVARLRDLIAKR